jgi:hypothetical protein
LNCFGNVVRRKSCYKIKHIGFDGSSLFGEASYPQPNFGSYRDGERDNVSGCRKPVEYPWSGIKLSIPMMKYPSLRDTASSSYST